MRQKKMCNSRPQAQKASFAAIGKYTITRIKTEAGGTAIRTTVDGEPTSYRQTKNTLRKIAEEFGLPEIGYEQNINTAQVAQKMLTLITDMQASGELEVVCEKE